MKIQSYMYILRLNIIGLLTLSLSTLLLFCTTQPLYMQSPTSTLSGYLPPTITPATPTPARTPSPNVRSHNRTNAAIDVIDEDNNYFLKVDLDDPNIKVYVLQALQDTGGIQPLDGIKGQLESQQYSDWAIINGDIFSYECPLQVNCAQGLTVTNSRQRSNWSEYGDAWQTHGNIGFDENNNPDVQVGDAQENRFMTIGGGPRIVISGGEPTCNPEYDPATDETNFPASGELFKGDVSAWCTDTEGVTMIGYSKDRRHLYMGISSGDQTVVEVAQWLKDQGAYEILRLDSGWRSGLYHHQNSSNEDGSKFEGAGSEMIANAFAVSVGDVPTPTPTPTNSWKVQYWGNENLTGEPRAEFYTIPESSYIFNNWGLERPHPDVSIDNFSVRYHKWIYFPGGEYRFRCHHRGGCRLRVDGEHTNLDAWWTDGNVGSHEQKIELSEGEHEIELEYFHTTEEAFLEFWWFGDGYLPEKEPCDDSTQWCVEYFGNMDLIGTAVLRQQAGTENLLGDTWGGSGPHPTFLIDEFSSRFRREMDFECGIYTFDLSADDGVRFWLEEEEDKDGVRSWIEKLYVDDWETGPSGHVKTIFLKENRYKLKLEHFEKSGHAKLTLTWQRQDDDRCVVNTPTATPTEIPTSTPTPTPSPTPMLTYTSTPTVIPTVIPAVTPTAIETPIPTTATTSTPVPLGPISTPMPSNPSSIEHKLFMPQIFH